MSNDDDDLIIISQSAREDLDELCKDAECTRAELVERLIRKRIAKKRKKAAC